MQKIGVREARDRIGQLLDAALAGEDIVIMRHGKPTARLVAVENAALTDIHFPDHSVFRAGQPAASRSSAELIREARDERG